MSAPPDRSFSVAEVKSRLSELLRAVEGGEVIAITRRGRRVATLVSIEPTRKQINLEELRAITGGMTYSDVSAVDIVREMRDARY